MERAKRIYRDELIDGIARQKKIRDEERSYLRLPVSGSVFSKKTAFENIFEEKTAQPMYKKKALPKQISCSLFSRSTALHCSVAKSFAK